MAIREKAPKAKKTTELSAGIKIGAMMAAAASAVATGYIPSYLNLYYTDTVGMSIGTIGLIIMITKITDGISDMIMGMIIDRTNTKLGKARPWLLAGAFGLAATMMLLFGCPADFSAFGKAFFCAALYFLACPVFGTMVGVASHSVINLISAESDDRAVLGVFKSYGSLIPVVVIGLVVPSILSSLGENQRTYTIVTAIFAAMAIVSGVLAVVLIRENVTERSRGHLQEKQKVGDSLRALVKNKYFIYMALGVIAYNLTAAPVATYYAKYIFGDVGKATLINLPSMLMIFLLPFAVPIVKKWGKRKSIMVGLGASAISHILILFANDNLGLFMVGKVISGLAVIPYFIALIPLTGDICDYALYTSGKPMDGTISSASAMGEKIGSGLTAGIASVMLQAAGYISKTDAAFVSQPDSALLMLRVLAGLYPAVLFGLAAFFFSKIDLEKQGIEKMRAELKEKGMR